MLQGWLPPGWALLGGGLAVLRLALFSYWVDGYHGGAVAAIGGALVLGALPRIKQRTRIRDGLWMALGVAILATSRPWEGLLICIPLLVTLILWGGGRTRGAQKAAPSGMVLLHRGIMPATLLLVVAGMAGYYDYRVFGDPFTLPYEINRATYASAPVFIWQQPRPEPRYRYKVMRDFYSRLEMDDFLKIKTLAGFFDGAAKKLGIVLFFCCGIALFPPLVLLPRALRDRRLRFLIITGAVFAFGLSLNAWLFPHYIAPFICAIYAILLQTMRHLRVCRPVFRSRGLALVRMIPIMCLLLAGVRLFARPLNLFIPRSPVMWYGTEPVGLARARVLAELESHPGQQLAIVRYAPDHVPFDDWVYNAADIDKSKVVWARDAEQGSNAELLRYFYSRTVWLVQPDSRPPAISPYPVLRPGIEGQFPAQPQIR